MKILSIGNSFSQDAQKWLHKISAQNGLELEAVNLFIGGCSLEQHWNNVEENKADYDLEYNGEGACQKISIGEALKMEKWDVITLQQASYHSGKPQAYIPYLQKLFEFVKALQPNAKIYFHQTWAYEIDSDHGSFFEYNHNQQEMYRRIKDASEMAARLINIPLLKTGTVIQAMRENMPEFDYKNGGLSLCRDGFHLSLDYGRFAAGVVWFYTLTGEKPTVKAFEDFDAVLLNKVIDFAVSVLDNNEI